MSKVCYINTRRIPSIDAPESEIAEYAHKLVEAGFAAFQNGQLDVSLDLLKKARDQWRRCSTWATCRQPIEILIDAVEHKLEQRAARGRLQ
jgi:hypothetical protein